MISEALVQAACNDDLAFGVDLPLRLLHLANDPTGVNLEGLLRHRLFVDGLITPRASLMGSENRVYLAWRNQVQIARGLVTPEGFNLLDSILVEVTKNRTFALIPPARYHPIVVAGVYLSGQVYRALWPLTASRPNIISISSHPRHPLHNP